LFRIRMRILAYLVTRYADQVVISPPRSPACHPMLLRWRMPAAEVGRPPRTSQMIRPILLDIAEANGHLNN